MRLETLVNAHSEMERITQLWINSDRSLTTEEMAPFIKAKCRLESDLSRHLRHDISIEQPELTKVTA